ncbi:MAG: hypothetical protein RL885_06480 [Planctomycetota bacterium]
MTRENEDIREHLVAFLDGEIQDEALRAKIERALESDPSLAREAQQLETSWKLLDAASPRERAPKDFVSQVVGRVHRPKPASRWRLRWRWIGPVAAAIVVALAMWAMWPDEGERLKTRDELALEDRNAPEVDDLEVIRSLHLLEDLEWLQENGPRIDLGQRLEMLALLQAQDE